MLLAGNKHWQDLGNSVPPLPPSFGCSTRSRSSTDISSSPSTCEGSESGIKDKTGDAEGENGDGEEENGDGEEEIGDGEEENGDGEEENGVVKVPKKSQKKRKSAPKNWSPKKSYSYYESSRCAPQQKSQISTGKAEQKFADEKIKFAEGELHPISFVFIYRVVVYQLLEHKRRKKKSSKKPRQNY